MRVQKQMLSNPPTWAADVGTRTCFQWLSSTNGKSWGQVALNFHSCQQQMQYVVIILKQSIMAVIALDEFGFFEFDFILKVHKSLIFPNGRFS